jgi:hypothetical protein
MRVYDEAGNEIECTYTRAFSANNSEEAEIRNNGA